MVQWCNNKDPKGGGIMVGTGTVAAAVTARVTAKGADVQPLCHHFLFTMMGVLSSYNVLVVVVVAVVSFGWLLLLLLL